MLSGLVITTGIAIGSGGILNQYSDECWELSSISDNLSIYNCVRYLEANPGATGQEVIDHHEISATSEREEFLTTPITP